MQHGEVKAKIHVNIRGNWMFHQTRVSTVFCLYATISHLSSKKRTLKWNSSDFNLENVVWNWIEGEKMGFSENSQFRYDFFFAIFHYSTENFIWLTICILFTLAALVSVGNSRRRKSWLLTNVTTRWRRERWQFEFWHRALSAMMLLN